MATDRTTLRPTPAVERRPALPHRVQRSAAETPRSPARTLQERLGNRATQLLIARSIAAPTRETTGAAVTVNTTAPPSIQLSKAVRLPANVSKPTDPAEREAEETARKVVRMQEPTSSTPKAQKAGAKGAVQRAEAVSSPTISSPPASPRVNISGGAPLPAPVRSHMEPRFGANFGNVRIHTGADAAHQSANLNAHAFTVGEHIFFGQNKFQPQSEGGRELIAHELTHTIQQGAAIQRSVDTTVTRRTPLQVQRASGPLDYFADKANLLPGFRLFTIVLGVNPINMASVDRSAANILRAMLELIPITGALIAQALDSYGIFARVGAWVEGQVRSLGMVGSSFKRAIDEFIGSLGISDLNPFAFGSLWERAQRIFTDPITRLINFGKSLATEIVGFIREAILLPLAQLAEGTRGYDLLKAVLGQDPITGQPVPRNAETLIGGFMKFIGQEEVWENIKRGNAVARAWAWFQSALQGLMGFLRQIPTLFMNALRSLEVIDLVLPIKAFAKIAGVFGGFAVQFVTWAGSAVWSLLEIIFDVVSPGALAYIKRTGAALRSILQNPLPFVGNLIRAAKLGFTNFADNIVNHLKAGLIDWLTGSLEGVYIPRALSLAELGKFAISVLGVSWAQIRGKIVKVLGPSGETIMKALETGFDIVVALVTGGPAAAWELIKEKLSDLKDQVVSGIIGFVTDTIVKKAIPKLIAMFIPGAGFISAIISIYDTIMVFVEKITKIIQVVTAFLDSIVAIAGGNIAAAATRVENILANLLSLSISFLAGFLGLGKVTDKIKEVIAKIRGTVDKAIDAAIAWIVDKAKKLFAGLFGKKDKPDDRTEGQKKTDLAAAVNEANKLLVVKSTTATKVKSQLPSIKTKFRLTAIELVSDGGNKYHVNAVINPSLPGSPVTLTGGKFKLALGGYKAHEGNKVALPAGNHKEVHLVTKHGPGVSDAALKTKLQNVLQLFISTRNDKIAVQQDRIRGANADIITMTKLIPVGGSASPQQQNRIDRANRNIAEANALIATYGAINQADKVQVFSALNKWRVSPMPTDRATIFATEAVMDQSVDDALNANQAKIDAAFIDSTGASKPVGTPLKITHSMGVSVGTGWEFDANMNIVRIGYVLKGVEFHLLISAPFEFKIETGYAIP